MARERYRMNTETLELVLIEKDGKPVDIAERHLKAWGSQSRNMAFQVMSDIDPFISPIDKSIVGGRRQKRDHMRAHNVVEAGNEPIYNRPPPKYEPRGVGEDIKRAYERLGG
jgi:hypothetical protein